MPSIADILDSISVSSLIKDEVIKNGEFEKTTRGVIYYSGGFTVVFPVVAGGKKWAFRCWHTEMGNVRKRFKTISDYINGLNSPYFCNFYYTDSGIVVDGKLFPTTRMDWVDGETINQYIIRNSQNKGLLLSLANEFLQLIDFLHSKHIAHGDLQHGNIIVTSTGKLKLVDYDSMFVPGLEGQSDIIIGKAEFQHPKRKQLKITSEKLDFFSEIVIYLSIISIAQAPDIIKDFSIEDSLLFQANDWDDFDNSAIYKRLAGLGNYDITLLINIISEYLREDNVNNLSPFPEILKNRQKKPKIKSFVCGNVDGIAFRGRKTDVSWEAENVGTVDINSVEVPAGHSCHKMIFKEDTDIILTIKNGLHLVRKKKHIKVIDAPKIKFSIDKKKLRKNGNSCEKAFLNWNVSNTSSVSIHSNGIILSTDKTASDFLVQPCTDTSYELIAIGLDNKTEFRSKINVIVREPARVKFQSDRNFTLPGVPVTISWDVHGAKNVRLNNATVCDKGEKIFKSTRDESYILSFEDDFGKKSNEITVKILPLPVIKSLLVDTPNINTVFGIQYTAPHFNGIPMLPIVESTFIDLAIPQIPSLSESGISVQLPEKTHITFSQKISAFLKSLF